MWPALKQALAYDRDARPESAVALVNSFKQQEKREAIQQQADAENSTDPTTGMEFIAIPGGKFMMGDDLRDNEKPIHEVTIKPSNWQICSNPGGVGKGMG